jgi:hypothetical protein
MRCVGRWKGGLAWPPSERWRAPDPPRLAPARRSTARRCAPGCGSQSRAWPSARPGRERRRTDPPAPATRRRRSRRSSWRTDPRRRWNWPRRRAPAGSRAVHSMGSGRHGRSHWAPRNARRRSAGRRSCIRRSRAAGPSRRMRCRRAAAAANPRTGAVVEQRHRPVRLQSRVVLTPGARARSHPEARLLTAERPHHLTSLRVDLVHGRGVSHRHQQVAVRGHGNRVGMEGVEDVPGAL